MAKKITVRGYDEKQLKDMSLEEFSKLISARARRSLKRGFSTKHKKLIRRVRKTPEDKPVRTHCRDMIIVPEFLGRVFNVYNGKEFVRVEVKLEMLGHYLGEFVQTRGRVSHSAPGMGATRASKFVALK